MNKFEIKYQPITNEENSENITTYYEVNFYIDERSFIEMVKEFELPFADNLAGRYSINIYRTEDFLLGRCPDFEGDKIALLACICGDSGCWPLATRVRVEGNRVIWDRFEQPHRKRWDYSGFGPFVFDFDEYKKEIQKVPFIKKLSERSRLSYWD
jgi:hypothetical protein